MPMAPLTWQSSSAMGASGGASTSGEGNTSSQGHPQGTEYTLQGVMRFLQMEWHRHERDRNSWEIERAEMKARIAKTEGENRSNKKLQDSLSNHIKLLENALKKEREKAKATTAATNNNHQTTASNGKGSEPPPKGNTKDASREGQPVVGKPPTQPHNSFLEVSDAASPLRDDPQRYKSRNHLEKSLQEVTYLLAASSHQAPAQRAQLTAHDMAAMQGLHGAADPIPIHADVSSLQQQHQQQQQQPQPRHSNHIHPPQVTLAQPSPSPKHQPPPVPSSSAPDLAHLQLHHPNKAPPPPQMTRHVPDQQPVLLGAAPNNLDLASRTHLQPSVSFPAATDEPPTRVGSKHDGFGRSPLVTFDDSTVPYAASEQKPPVDPDAWNFDDPVPASTGAESTQGPPALDVDRFPNPNHAPKSPPRTGLGSHRRKGSMSRRRSSEEAPSSKELSTSSQTPMRPDSTNFKIRFALRGHLDVVRAVIFTGGGSPSEPEICTTGDDGVVKRWIIPASYGNFGPQGGSAGGGSTNGGGHNDLDVVSYFTHRGHTGIVTCLAACPLPQNFLTGGRAPGDGWVFSGGQDATVRVWERGRVDPKATLHGHTDAVWSVCVLPAISSAVFGDESHNIGGPNRILLASGGADGTIKLWALTAPPQSFPTHSGSRRGVGGSRRHSVTSGSGFSSSPRPSVATSSPCHHTLVHTISRQAPSPLGANLSPTCIAPASATGETFVASYNDAAVIIFDTRTGEEIMGMASLETYNGTVTTGVNSVVAVMAGIDAGPAGVVVGGGGGGSGGMLDGSGGHLLSASASATADDDGGVGRGHGPTGSSSSAGSGVEGVIISGHEDRYIRFFDANSGQCTYTMLAHPAPISALSLSPDGRELVSAGHDASLRFWSLDKRACTQDMAAHRLMRDEGVTAVVWSQDGRWVVSAGGDGVVKVFSR